MADYPWFNLFGGQMLGCAAVVGGLGFAVGCLVMWGLNVLR